MVKLPLKFQVGVRDNWDSTDCAVQKQLKKLRDVIGKDIDVQPEWQLLLAELDKAYDDKAALVLDAASCVIGWAQGLEALAEDENNSDWAEELLDKTEDRIRLHLEVGKSNEPVLKWSDERKSFILELARPPIPSPFLLESMFKEQFVACFKEEAAPVSLAQRAAATAGDDWADVAVDSQTGRPAVVEQQSVPSRLAPAPAKAGYDTLPDFTALPRPDELLLKPPYHLIVTSSNSRSVEVQCSHSPTLQFLADYLKKWCKVNNQDSRKPPSVEIKLYQSAFGLNLNYDRLTLESEGRWNLYTATPMLVLSLVEGTLGYQSVRAEDGRWMYRRDVELRKCR
ncbi:hypothetical protein Micbo1qcDRAFT_196767 [Microdochium bolleyi]|uniref:Uncharacterized protein n=1 Tax=Microdochium bolleyi TaxID=196109 RepID=A0A136IX25_9PEZI|nr:hypothetical protein Micbo1qcDRAFT_196767 [Microdochium bolleyi]